MTATAQMILDRLNILGYTDDVMKKEFIEYVERQLENVKNPSHIQLYGEDVIELESKFWSIVSFETYVDVVTKILSVDFKFYKVETYKLSLTNIMSYVIFQGRELLTSMPCITILGALRFLLKCVPTDSMVIQDYTEIYHGGWVDDNDILSFEPREKIIILTEGHTDIEILKRSLSILYPHLADYYSFFDFEGFNSQGGAGNLVNVIKSFSAAGIKNQIIAIFDNDSAARDAQLSLKNITLPTHIKIINYPYLELASNYPTIGPTGIHAMDVNSLACSIEMYLGIDVLTNDSNTLSPIQWKGYIPRIDAYQGEVLDKKTILERFSYKLKETENSDVKQINEKDWEGLKSIFKLIFECFSVK